jgi:hypothetical protein
MTRRERIPTAREVYFPDGPRVVEDPDRLERRFFRALRQENGTYKYTRPNRLDDLNDLVAGLLPPDRPLRLMDVAVSSGISTLEWSRALDRLGVEHEMTAGDINLACQLVSIGRGLHVLVDATGYPLQYDVFGRASPNPPARRALPFYWPFILLSRLYVGSSRRDGRWARRRPVTLVSPRLIDHGRIALVEDDIVAGGGDRHRGRYHVVRAANILNRSYFDGETLARIGANLRDRLVEGGLLVVCTTTGDDGDEDAPGARNDGTVFALRDGGRFEVVGRIGAGSAVEDVLLGLPAAAPAGA